ncbi:MAG: hypothetical protein F6J92_35315 [Symploca sp. SIO1A3]|nr:hypothetical protein [Symploca sp. SIO1A3]
MTYAPVKLTFEQDVGSVLSTISNKRCCKQIALEFLCHNSLNIWDREQWFGQ